MARFSRSTRRATTLFSVVDRDSTPGARVLAPRPDIEILPLFADRRMDFLTDGDAVERVANGLAILLDGAIDLLGQFSIETMIQTANRRPQ